MYLAELSFSPWFCYVLHQNEDKTQLLLSNSTQPIAVPGRSEKGEARCAGLISPLEWQKPWEAELRGGASPSFRTVPHGVGFHGYPLIAWINDKLQE